MNETPWSKTDLFHRQAAEVRSVLGEGLEVVEATTDMVVYVTADEHEHGVRGDPNLCMFSAACKRAFGSHGVLFYPNVAYVDMIDPKDQSRRIIMRFSLPARTRSAIEAFDRNQDERKEATFLLKAVPKSMRLSEKRKVNQSQRARRRRGEAADPDRAVSGQAGGQKSVAQRGMDGALKGVRRGQGKVKAGQLGHAAFPAVCGPLRGAV